jgi:hypothetical protein
MEHARKTYWLRGQYREWFIHWLYWLLAGHLMTVGGIVRLPLIAGFGVTALLAPVYIGGIAWIDAECVEPIRWYHYFYFSGLTLTTLG